jgi:hypothetical protein
MYSLKAELVLHDCAYALRNHTPSLQGEDFRLSWWTIVSLLRAVGHVLDKVDKFTSEKHKMVIEQEYNKLKSAKPEPAIYWQFINFERDRFLKEYQYGIDRFLCVSTIMDGKEYIVEVGLDNMIGARISSEDASSHTESIMNSGPFKGLNEVEVATIAVEWWKVYLINIKTMLGIDPPDLF